MNVIVLAAGYATRLYPLTKHQPKPLLPVKGKPIIDYIIDAIEARSDIEAIYVVSNAFFADNFEAWAKERRNRTQCPLHIVNDGTSTIETRLGAIRDIQFVIDQYAIDSDVLVLAGDNLFEDDLSGLIDLGQSKHEVALAVVPFEKRDLLKEYGVVVVNDSHRVIEFVEKSEQPPSTLVATCLYYFPRAVLADLQAYIECGRDLDAPGNFLKWLVDQKNIWAYDLSGKWYDIGSKESYEAVQK